MGCHSLHHGVFPIQGSNLCLPCLLHCRQTLYRWATGKPWCLTFGVKCCAVGSEDRSSHAGSGCSSRGSSDWELRCWGVACSKLCWDCSDAGTDLAWVLWLALDCLSCPPVLKGKTTVHCGHRPGLQGPGGCCSPLPCFWALCPLLGRGHCGDGCHLQVHPPWWRRAGLRLEQRFLGSMNSWFSVIKLLFDSQVLLNQSPTRKLSGLSLCRKQ